jgi:hypothetical protein
MRRGLRRHPDSRCEAVKAVAVEIAVPRPGVLALSYSVDGTIAALAVPPLAQPVRADGLWQHTCFEVFLKAGTPYTEYNFAPSRAWAAYRFDDTRKGRRPAEVEAPGIAVEASETRLLLRAELILPREADWQMGLSAVLEEKNGALSYWALAHPPGQPDFHHPDCFTLDLRAVQP